MGTGAADSLPQAHVAALCCPPASVPPPSSAAPTLPHGPHSCPLGASPLHPEGCRGSPDEGQRGSLLRYQSQEGSGCTQHTAAALGGPLRPEAMVT